MFPNSEEMKRNRVFSDSYSLVFFISSSSIFPWNSGNGKTSLPHVTEIQVLDKVFNPFLEEIHEEDKNEICVQKRSSFIDLWPYSSVNPHQTSSIRSWEIDLKAMRKCFRKTLRCFL